MAVRLTSSHPVVLKLFLNPFLNFFHMLSFTITDPYQHQSYQSQPLTNEREKRTRRSLTRRQPHTCPPCIFQITLFLLFGLYARFDLTIVLEILLVLRCRFGTRTCPAGGHSGLAMKLRVVVASLARFTTDGATVGYTCLLLQRSRQKGWVVVVLPSGLDKCSSHGH